MNFNDFLKVEYIKDENGKLLTRIKIEDYCYNIHKIVHGGVIMTLIDSACGKAASDKVKKDIVTLDGSTNFLRACKDTKYLYGHCKVKKAGRKIISVDCDVVDDLGNLIAIGRFNFYVIK